MTCPPPRSALIASIIPASTCAAAVDTKNSAPSKPSHEAQRIVASSDAFTPTPPAVLRLAAEGGNPRAGSPHERRYSTGSAMTTADVIRLLDLRPHPEGGHFRETLRDTRTIEGGRAASTAIYFLLAASERSH